MLSYFKHDKNKNLFIFRIIKFKYDYKFDAICILQKKKGEMFYLVNKAFHMII